MKALQLAKCLNRSEATRFESAIKNKGRKPLLQLWKYLHKCETDKPEKADIFSAVFKARYDPKKDYLLRNELRLLGEELTAFILQQEFDHDMKENPHFRQIRYLKALRKRNLEEIFTAEYDKLFSRTEAEMQIDIAEEMAREKMLMLYQVFDSRNIAREVYEACEDYVESVRQRAEFSVRLSEFHRDIALRRWSLDPINKDIVAPEAQPPRDSLDIRTDSDSAALARYYAGFTKALHSSAEDRVQVLLDAIEAIEACSGFPGIKQWRLKAGCLNFLGITYNELGETDRHFDMFRQALQLYEENESRLITPLMNYLQGLLYYKRVDTFWEELERFNSWFDDGQNLENLNRIIQHAHEATGSYDQALVYLNKLQVSSDDEYLLVKSVLVSIYYHTKEFDLALTESTNALQFLRSRDSDVFRYHCHELEFKLTALLARYEMALVEEQGPIVKRIREYLQSANEEFLRDMAATFLRSKWVLERAEEICGSEAPAR